MVLLLAATPDGAAVADVGLRVQVLPVGRPIHHGDQACFINLLALACVIAIDAIPVHVPQGDPDHPELPATIAVVLPPVAPQQTRLDIIVTRAFRVVVVRDHLEIPVAVRESYHDLRLAVAVNVTRIHRHPVHFGELTCAARIGATQLGGSGLGIQHHKLQVVKHSCKGGDDLLVAVAVYVAGGRGDKVDPIAAMAGISPPASTVDAIS